MFGHIEGLNLFGRPPGVGLFDRPSTPGRIIPRAPVASNRPARSMQSRGVGQSYNTAPPPRPQAGYYGAGRDIAEWDAQYGNPGAPGEVSGANAGGMAPRQVAAGDSPEWLQGALFGPQPGYYGAANDIQQWQQQAGRPQPGYYGAGNDMRQWDQQLQFLRQLFMGG